MLRPLLQVRLTATGDQIDLGPEASWAGVHNAGRYSRASVVQITWALILELCCAMDQRRSDLASGSWQRSPVFSVIEPEFDELEGQTLVVLGAGDIGRGVLTIGKAFGMHCIGLTSRSSDAELEAALRQADVLSLHAPLTSPDPAPDQCRAAPLDEAHARLVNMARGGLVQLDDLCAALRQLAGAAVMCCPWSPRPRTGGLAGHPQSVDQPPHGAWSSRQARAVWCRPWRAICRPTSQLKRLQPDLQRGTARGG